MHIKSMMSKNALLCCGASLLTASIVGAQGPPLKLIINGKVATTDIRLINGHIYAPIAEIAKAQDQIVRKTAEGYELINAGGANQVNGKRQGKVGDLLFTGDWRFQVSKFELVNEYMDQYLQDAETVKPDSANDTLVVVSCLLKNGRNESHTPRLHKDAAGNTALTDANGQSYPPIHFDVRRSGHYDGTALLPGAASNFTVIFSVPKDTPLKDLVFTIRTDDGAIADTDVRINLVDDKTK